MNQLISHLLESVLAREIEYLYPTGSLFIHTHTHMHIYTYIHIYIYTCTHKHIYIDLYDLIYIYTHIYVCVCVYTKGFKKILYWIFTLSFLFYFLVFWLQGMWDLSSLTRDWTHTPCIGRWSLNHWFTREVPIERFFIKIWPIWLWRVKTPKICSWQSRDPWTNALISSSPSLNLKAGDGCPN